MENFTFSVVCYIFPYFFPTSLKNQLFFKIYKEAGMSLTGVSQNRCSEKFHKSHKKIPAIESFFDKKDVYPQLY